ncbi:TIGR03364 family FAD-dependent oxidoreductase [Rhodopirellula sp. MGV]|uniref:TIGR03364 family FAD-dependent oxidoreductase n=1 Tax=Rhodopirellula sp. MGV TaxID=2023130 RepID=UPI000B95F744|nr:TIGR03364 family FAD-dependent oxidoreductase [Rhodopirellula sp. MGV]OYP31629.1 TIGR03364 family FAD-dependent oxidoreductase [Rhodopirellula sp. MGV]PNY33471.1 TIGR03364 family FAD-dependent oxidoreductase [Rhodopirellula baltica]
MEHNQADILIIGGGVLGAFHAYHALRNGQRVVLLERHAAPQGATVRNFGQVVPSGLDSQWQHYGRESLQIYQDLQSEIDLTVRQLGTIYLASDDEELALIDELHAINAANDYPSELWSTGRCLNRFPQLRADYCRGGLFFPAEISVNPRQMIHRLHQWLAGQSNYQSYFRSSVQDLSVASDGRVQAITSDGRTFRAAKAILCCGSEFRALFPEVFQRSELETVKLQMMRLKPQPGVTIPGNVLTGLSIRRYESFAQCPSWKAIKANERADSFAKRWGIHLLFKQELDGGIILGDSHEYASVAESDGLGFDLRSDIEHYFLAEGKEIFDLPSWEVESRWFGQYCQTNCPDGIYNRTIDDHIHVVTGIGGKGMTSSAGYARSSIERILHD